MQEGRERRVPTSKYLYMLSSLRFSSSVHQACFARFDSMLDVVNLEAGFPGHWFLHVHEDSSSLLVSLAAMFLLFGTLCLASLR